jgi:protein O-mannosyl-transferase
VKKIPEKRTPGKRNPSYPTKKTAGQSDTYFILAGIALMACLGAIIYSNSFACSFHFDDVNNIVENEKLRNLSDFRSTMHFSYSRLIGYFTFALNYHFGGLNVWGYHLVNLVIHIMNAGLVGWLARLIFSSPALAKNSISANSRILALSTALLFVSHPLATQSVTYIVQRLASLAAFFYLLSLVLYGTARLKKTGATFSYALYAGAIVSGILAMLTKENAYTLPFAVLLFEFFFISEKKIKINFKDYRVILILIGMLGFIAFLLSKYSFEIFKPILPEQGITYTLTPANYLMTQFSVILKYIQLLIVPVNQMVEYDFPIADHFFDIRTFGSFIVLVALLVTAVLCFKKNRIISFGIIWFFLTLSVESSFIPIRDVIFEHRTYLPSVGFFLVLVAIIYNVLWKKHKAWALGILGCIVLVNSILTYQRNKVWENDFTLLNDNIEKAPGIARPLYNRGQKWLNLNEYDKAIADNSGAIKINPGYYKAYVNRATAYAHLKQWDKAIADNTKAIAINATLRDAYYNRGAVFGNVGELDKAIDDFTSAIRINPKDKEAYDVRGITYGNLGQWDKAIADFSKAIEIDPEDKLARSRLETANRYIKK